MKNNALFVIFFLCYCQLVVERKTLVLMLVIQVLFMKNKNNTLDIFYVQLVS